MPTSGSRKTDSLSYQLKVTLFDQYLAIRKSELDRLEKLRSAGEEVSERLYQEMLKEYKDLEENERLRKVFFPKCK